MDVCTQIYERIEVKLQCSELENGKLKEYKYNITSLLKLQLFKSFVSLAQSVVQSHKSQEYFHFSFVYARYWSSSRDRIVSILNQSNLSLV